MGKQIILLEDDPGVREVIELILDLEGYQVTSFENVEGFMNRTSAGQPDLFILDVMLPDGSGIEVCGELKAIGGQIPVLMMSAHAKAEEISRSCIADAFIAKPFDLNNLLTTVEKLITTGSKPTKLFST